MKIDDMSAHYLYVAKYRDGTYYLATNPIVGEPFTNINGVIHATMARLITPDQLDGSIYLEHIPVEDIEPVTSIKVTIHEETEQES